MTCLFWAMPWIIGFGNICPSSSLTFPLPDRTKPPPLLCLTPDDFTRQWSLTMLTKNKAIYWHIVFIKNITKCSNINLTTLLSSLWPAQLLTTCSFIFSDSIYFEVTTDTWIDSPFDKYTAATALNTVIYTVLFKCRPRLSAAYESKNIKERRPRQCSA